MKTAGVILALAVALALQPTLSQFTIGSGMAIDLVLIAVVAAALTSGPVAGLLAGTAGGLVQDALARGIIGVSGLVKSLIGFVVGVAGSQFIITQPLPRAVVFFTSAVFHQVCFSGVYSLLDGRPLQLSYGAVASRALANSVLGVLIFHAIEALPGLVQRRRVSSSARRRRL